MSKSNGAASSAPAPAPKIPDSFASDVLAMSKSQSASTIPPTSALQNQLRDSVAKAGTLNQAIVAGRQSPLYHADDPSLVAAINKQNALTQQDEGQINAYNAQHNPAMQANARQAGQTPAGYAQGLTNLQISRQNAANVPPIDTSFGKAFGDAGDQMLSPYTEGIADTITGIPSGIASVAGNMAMTLGRPLINDPLQVAHDDALAAGNKALAAKILHMQMPGSATEQDRDLLMSAGPGIFVPPSANNALNGSPVLDFKHDPRGATSELMADLMVGAGGLHGAGVEVPTPGDMADAVNKAIMPGDVGNVADNLRTPNAKPTVAPSQSGFAYQVDNSLNASFARSGVKARQASPPTQATGEPPDEIQVNPNWNADDFRSLANTSTNKTLAAARNAAADYLDKNHGGASFDGTKPATTAPTIGDVTPKEAQQGPAPDAKPIAGTVAQPQPTKGIQQAVAGEPGALNTVDDVIHAIGAANPVYADPSHAAALKALLDSHAQAWAKSTGRPIADYVPSVWHSVVKGEEPTQETAPSGVPASTEPPAPVVAPSMAPVQGAGVPATAAPPRVNMALPISEIHTDPQRFQYKVGYGTGGSTGSTRDIKAWDPYSVGLKQVWVDPADGKTYMVNGHNTLDLAKRTGQTTLPVQYIDAPDAKTARAIGAITNINEGKGTPIDTAKAIRDGGDTPESLAAKGVNIKSEPVRQGMAMANLSPTLFSQAVTGELPTDRATIIGGLLPDHNDQAALMKLLGKRNMTNDQIRELAESVNAAPRVTSTTHSLFGDDETTQNLAVERANVAAHVKSELKKAASALKTVAKPGNAERLHAADNVINAQKSAELGTITGRAADVFDQYKNAAGTSVSDTLNDAARRIAAGENKNAVYKDTVATINAAIPDLARGNDGRPSSTAEFGFGGDSPRGNAQVPTIEYANEGRGGAATEASHAKPADSTEHEGLTDTLFQKQPAPHDKNLVAVHNATSDGILAAAKLGGIPAPSIAILGKDIPHNQYGEISLVGPREMIDPETDSRNKVFSRDAYSPTQPRPTVNLTERQLSKALDSVMSGMKDGNGRPERVDRYELNGQTKGNLDPRDLAERIAQHDAVRAAFLKDHGVDISPYREVQTNGYVRYHGREHTSPVRELLDSKYGDGSSYSGDKAVAGWVQDKIAPHIGEPLLQHGKSRVPYTLDNIVAAMTGKGVRGNVDTMTQGLEKQLARSAKSFKSVSEMHANEGMIARPADYDARRDSVQNQFFGFSDGLTPAYRYNDTWTRLDDSAKSLGDYLKGPRTPNGFKTALARNGFDPAKVDADTVKAGMTAAQSLHALPTRYFEAKPLRGVKLNEFAGAVVPHDVSPEVIDALKGSGINDIRTYQNGDDEGRRQVIESLARDKSALFQGAKGSVTFRPEDGRAIVRFFRSADMSTAVHEIAHVWRRTLSQDHLNTLEDHYGINDGNWTRDHEEQFARDFEKYAASGKAPKPSLQAVFDNLKEWLHKIYDGVKGSPLEGDLHPTLRRVFDEMLGKDDDAGTSVHDGGEVSGNGTAKTNSGDLSGMTRPAKYAGSINTEYTGVDSKGDGYTRAAIDKAGLTEHHATTIARIEEKAKNLGLNSADVSVLANAWRNHPDKENAGALGPHTTVAVRNIQDKHTQAVMDADEKYQSDPTPENRKALDEATANHADSTYLRSVNAQAAGTILRAHGEKSAAFEGTGYAGDPNDLLAPQRQPASGWAKRTRAASGGNYGKGAKLVTSDEAAQAIARIKAGRNTPETTDTLHQLDPADVDDAAIVGAHHLDAGTTEFGAWSQKMRDDLGQHLTYAELQTILQNSRAEIASRTGSRQGPPASSLFVDHIAKTLGTNGAKEFMNGLLDHPALLDKVVAGDARTSAENAIVNKLYNDNLPAKGAAGARNAAVRQVQEAAKQARIASRSNGTGFAKRGTAYEAGITPEERLSRIISASHGMNAGKQFATSLDPDILAKVARGRGLTAEESDAVGKAMIQAQGARATSSRPVPAEAIHRAVADTRKALRMYGDEVRAGNPKEVLREQLQRTFDHDPAKIAEINSDLAGIDKHDIEGLSDVLIKHSDQGAISKLIDARRSGLLSGPQTLQKIGLSHLLYTVGEELKRGPARMVSPDNVGPISGKAIAASLAKVREEGVPAAATMMKHGPTAVQMMGKDPLSAAMVPYRAEFNAGIRNGAVNKAVNAVVRFPYRLHGALYHMNSVYAMERALQEESFLAAQREGKAAGLTGSALRAHIAARTPEIRDAPTPKMIEAAAAQAREGTFQNDNAMHSGLQFVKHLKGGAFAPAINTAIPFDKVPVNIGGKALEYKYGSLYAPVRAMVNKVSGKTVTPAEARILANTFGRGALGAPLIAAGVAAYMTHHASAGDPKHFQPATLNVNGRKYDTSDLGPAVSGGSEGVELANLISKAAKGKLKGSDATGLLANEFSSIPLVNASESLAGVMQDGLTKSVVGQWLASWLPYSAALSQVAALTDKSGDRRHKSSALDYVKNAIPGERETLPIQRSGKNNTGTPVPQPGWDRSVPDTTPPGDR